MTDATYTVDRSPLTDEEVAELRALWEPERSDDDYLAGGYARLLVLSLLDTLDSLTAERRELRRVIADLDNLAPVDPNTRWSGDAIEALSAARAALSEGGSK